MPGSHIALGPSLVARRGARSGGAGDPRPLQPAPPAHRGGAGRASAELAPDQGRALRRAYRALPSRDANDGLVPTLSQGGPSSTPPWPTTSLLSHFRDVAHDPPHVDWLVTGSDFDRRRFEALWADVVNFLVGQTRASAGERDEEKGYPATGS